jgi:hypothetical protein
MTENHDDSITMLDDEGIEIKIKLNLNIALDVAIKNYLLNYHAATATGIIDYKQLWEQVNYSLEIHAETLCATQRIIDLAKAIGDEQNTNKA